jgi:predicted DsbA family dithiol-disulfide isomerase
MAVEVWIDFLCPWAYLGQDRTSLLRDLGFEVRSRPYELHPELPPEGRPVRPNGRLAQVYEHIARECAEVGLPFRPPTHVPRTRDAHRCAEAVAAVDPEHHEPVVAGLFRAHFVDGEDLGDPGLLEAVATSCGVGAEGLRAEMATDRPDAAVGDSIRTAQGHGVAATPAWRFPSGFVLPGVQPRAQVERWARRLAAGSGT